MGRKSKKQKWKDAISAKVTKLTSETVAKLKLAFSMDCNVKQACYYAEISQDSYYRWIKKYPELSEEFGRMRCKVSLAAKANIAHAIQVLKDLNLSKWLIEREKPEEYEETIDRDNVDTRDDDKKAVEEFHKKLKENLIKRSMEKAREDGEICGEEG